MPRRYDRLIRFYDSWFDDLQDQEKELSQQEQLTVLLAIRECQVQESLQPLDGLPISIRRCLSMSTLREQILRILEKTSRMKVRGSLGGRKTASLMSEHAADGAACNDTGGKGEDRQPLTFEVPTDGKERNLEGLVEKLREWNLSDEEIDTIAKWSDFGLIGHQVWKAIYSANSKSHKREYFLKVIGYSND